MKLFDKIFKSANRTIIGDLTTITRTETLEGISIPGIIHNMQYHFTDLQAYSDGLVSCWQMVDLPMFKEKLNNGWVVTSIPDGEAMSIFNLGLWYIEAGEWLHTKDSLYDFVYSLVKNLNPTLENLVSYNGNSSKKVGKVSVAKHFIPDPKPYYYDNPNDFLPKKVNGEKFRFFFRHDNSRTYLADLSLYKSGHIEITNLPEKKTFRFEQINELVDSGQLTTDLKIGERVTICNLGSFKIKSGNGIEMKFKINELTDTLNELNGSENSIAKCARLFDEYKQNPTRRLRDSLKEAYEGVPEHQRIYVGTMDTKDYEVRQVIYGDIVKKEWEEEYGYEYPYNDMPTPIDEH
jgi:hypothetical protein